MDKLLHRGKYAIADELLTHDQPVAGWQRIFGITRMFKLEDRVTAYFLMGYFLLSLLTFATGMTIGYLKSPTEDQWAGFWGIFLIVQLALLIISTFWLGIGGIRDTRRLFRSMRSDSRDPGDTGELKHDDPQPEGELPIYQTPS
jgi:SSS family solute:Na+ symporter